MLRKIMTKRAPTLDGVIAAAKRLEGLVTRTPLLPLDWQGGKVWIKAECLQLGGSFKLRGASNTLALLSAEERKRGVVAFSSGNHAQGVALAAARLGIAATIVMPSDAPAVKRHATEAAGARVVEYDRARENRDEIAAAIAAETKAVVVPPFDHAHVIEGQGSVGVEIGEQMAAQAGRPPGTVIIPCGGGGLTTGVALALPEAEIVPVEPAGWDDMVRSLEEGEIRPVAEDAPATLCDALQTKRVSDLTFGVLHPRGVRGKSVSDAEVSRAMAHAMRHLRLVAEPGGAAALAALLAGKTGDSDGGTVVIISGGNVDPAIYAEILRSQAAEMTR
jgi:threonine dehydratase